ncbi:MAG: hypothetical protein E7149_08935 [Rikenellaceae bacterium]|nr:hypothetical protein [Rikenellaceae bacterium]
MKNIFKTLAAVAMIALSASCSKDAAEVPAVNGDATVTFSVEMPGIASRATNDGTTAQELYYAVYEAGTVGKTDGQFLFQDKQAINLSTTVNLELVADQTYDIVFWAQAAGTHTPDLENKTIAMNYAAAVAGADETRDAFIGFVDNLEIKGSANETVYLKRPFAQLNVALSEGQLAAAEKAGFELKTVTVKTATHTGFSIAEGIGDATGSLQAVEFKAAEFAAFNPKQLPGTTYDWVSFNYVLPALPSDVIDVEITFTDKNGKTINVPKFTNVPIERNHRTNIVGDLLTDPAKFEVIINPIFDDEPGHVIDGVKSVQVSTDAELAAALALNAEYLHIVLAADVNIASGHTTMLGGAATKTLTIEGLTGNETLNFTTNYMPTLNTAGELKVKNLNITRVAPTANTWDVRNLMLRTNTEMENVTLEKGVAICGNGNYSFKNVAFAESGNYYSMWIEAIGATVTIENSSFTAAQGRGIKIDEEYVDAAELALVTLNVAGTEFITKEKAAVIVKSAAGAVINWGAGNDISQVTEDQDFAVWVDEDAAQHDAKVIVNGCNKKIEGTIVEEISTMAELESVLQAAGQAGAGDTTIILKDDIDMTGQAWTPIAVDGYNGADIVTLNGNGKTIKGLSAGLFKGGFAGGSGIVIKDLTIENAAIVANNTQGYGAFVGCADSMDEITLINCHLVNSTIITPNDGQDESRIGGLIGWTAGYNNQNDGPVDSYITVKNCSVTGCTLKGWGSIGGIVGHAGANAATFTVIEDCTVTNNQLISTDDGGWRVGVVIGTANNGQAEIKNITESGNTLKQDAASDTKNPTGEKRNYYGRFVPAGTGSLVIDGVQQKTTSQVNFEALVSNGGAVALTENVEITAPMEINANVTIDLAGKTISVSAPMVNNGTMNIAGGTITNTSATVIENNGVMALSNGAKIVAKQADGITTTAGGTLTIEAGATIESNGAPVRALGGEVMINGGTFKQTGTAVGSVSTYRYAVDCRENGKITVNGGDFTSGNGIINVNAGAEVIINGGKFTNNVEKSMTRHLAYVGGSLIIKDGEFYGVANSAAGGCFFCIADPAASIAIEGGKFTSLWSSGAANNIVESYYGGSTWTLSITGGLFNTNKGIVNYVEANTDAATMAAYPYKAK